MEDPDRIGPVAAVGLYEVLFARQGPWRIQAWSTSITDVATGQLLDVIEGRSAAGACRWFAARPPGWGEGLPRWRTHSTWSSSPTSASMRSAVGSRTRPSVTEAANTIRSTGPAGLLTRADERLDDRGRRRLLGLLDAGDPRGEVRTAWHG